MSEAPNDENTPNCVTQIGKAKIVAQIARIVRRAGLDYSAWRYISKRVRQECALRPAKKGRRLPRILNADDFRRFFAVVDRAENVQHALILRLLFQTAVRVSELCNIEVGDVDLENCHIRINAGKGDKDRVVLFSTSFLTTLRTHLAAHPRNRWLFQTRRNSKYTTRRVQQIMKTYAEQAQVSASPHTLRHQALSWLTKQGIADVKLQMLAGHSRPETLRIYQHLTVADVEGEYQAAMRLADA